MCADGEGFVPRPAAGFPITSNAGPRSCSGCSANHTGTDFATPCGTKIAGPPAGCVKINGGGNNSSTPNHNGYGNVAQFDCGNGVKIQYGHLNNSDSYGTGSNQITTGNTGQSTGCHLDYKIFIGDKSVDAQCATGNVTDEYTYGNSSTHHNVKCPFSGPVNVCDPAVQEALRKHSTDVLGSANTKGVPDGSTSPATGGDDDDHADQTAGTVVDQGTDGRDGTGGATGEDDPIEEPGKDPEEDDPTPPTPGDEYDPIAATPICDNSTCITQDTIDNAKHKRVKYDKADPHWNHLKPDGACKPPTKTGATVFRQVVGALEEYPDSFCTNQGCTYINEGGSGNGECQ